MDNPVTALVNFLAAHRHLDTAAHQVEIIVGRRCGMIGGADAVGASPAVVEIVASGHVLELIVLVVRREADGPCRAIVLDGLFGGEGAPLQGTVSGGH